MELPQSKHDLERVEALAQAGPRAAEPRLAELLAWLRDANWPVARPLADLLVTVGAPLVPHLRTVLKSDDDMWVYWVLQLVVERWPRELVQQLEPELHALARQGERAENDVVALRILAQAGLGEPDALRRRILNRRRALLELAAELEGIAQLLPDGGARPPRAAEDGAATDVRIRPETAADVHAIEAVTAAAFLHAPHTSHTEQFVVRALREAGQLELSLVAEADGAVVGHVAVSPVTVSDGAQGWFGLGPISVVPGRQRRGIGSLLVREALRRLRERGAAGCVLLGDPAYYGRFGFRPEPGLVLPDVPPEYFQAIAFGGPLPCGTVSYHEAFAAQG